MNTKSDLDNDKLEYKDFFPDLIRPTNDDEQRFDKAELTKGTEEEHEHTDDDLVAAKIAKDHLKQDPKYYTNMDKCNSLKNKQNPPTLIQVIDKKVNIIKSSDKIETAPKITGDIDKTPINPVIASGNTIFGEGGSKITEPRAGITSDMGRKRWTIDAYPSNKKITPSI